MTPRRPKLIQEKYAGRTWPVLLCGLLASRTRGAAAAPVVDAVVSRWPTWEAASKELGVHLDEEGRVETAPTEKADDAWRWLMDAFAPLGLSRRRVDYLLRWLVKFRVDGLPRSRSDVLALPGAGDYVADCFAMFAMRMGVTNVTKDGDAAGICGPRQGRGDGEAPTSGDGPLTSLWEWERDYGDPRS